MTYFLLQWGAFVVPIWCAATGRRYNASFDSESGDVSVYAIVSGDYEELLMKVELTTADISVLYLDEFFSYFVSDDSNSEVNLTLVNELNQTSRDMFEVHVENLRVLECSPPYSEPNKLVLGMGPSSSLVRGIRSVNLLKHSPLNGEVQFSTSLETFHESCVPESMFRIPFSQRHDYSGTVVARYHLIYEPGTTYTPRLNSRPEPVRIASPVGISAGTKILTLPYILAGIIDNLLLTGGAVRDNGIRFSQIESYNYNDCSTNFHLLPSIGLIFFLDDHTTIAGELVLSPSDYIKNHTDGGCSFRFRPVGPSGGSLYFKPWRLPGVNMRISSTELYLCDSISFLPMP